MSSKASAAVAAEDMTHLSELPKQANSGGLRLAEEFNAKTTLKNQTAASTNVDQDVPQKITKNSKSSKAKQNLRVISSHQDRQHTQDAGSPLIYASYPSAQLDSPDKKSSRRSSFSRQNSEEAVLKRQYSDSDSYGSRGASKSRRSSLAASPTKERKGRDWVITTADGGQTIEPDGLHFLLKTCELLDPSCAGSRSLETVKEEGHSQQRRPTSRASRSLHRRGSQPVSPTKPRPRQNVAVAELHQGQAAAPGELPYFKPEQGVKQEEYMPENHDADLPASRADSDDDYLPRRSSGRSAAGRSSRAAARAAAAAAASQQQQQQDGGAKPLNRPPGAPTLSAGNAAATAASTCPTRTAAPSRTLPSPAAEAGQAALQQLPGSLPEGGEAATEGPAAAAPAPVAGSSKAQLVSGPCMNPDCEHPYDSPQWRKGPASAPVLCNACGTRWLRNGTLKPLVPRRGIRYKNKPRTVSAPPAGKAARAAAQQQAERAQQQQQAEHPAPVSASPDLLAAQAPAQLASCHQDAAQQYGEQYQQYCQLAASLGMGPDAGGGAAFPAALGMNSMLATLSPSMLAALLAGSVAPPPPCDGGTAPDPMAYTSLHQHHGQQMVPEGGVSPGVWGGVSPGKPLPRPASQVFQLQAMAGPQAAGSVFFPPPSQAYPSRGIDGVAGRVVAPPLPDAPPARGLRASSRGGEADAW